MIAVCLTVSGCGFIFLSEQQEVVESIPVYPGASWKGSFKTTWPDSAPSAGILYGSSAEPKEILTFYREQMPEEGWVLEAEQEPSGLEEQGSLLFRKGKFWCRISIRGQKKPYDISVRVGTGNE